MYALFVAELKGIAHDELDDSAIRFLSKTKGIEDSIAPESKLSLGCWQLDLKTHLLQFCTLCRQASQSQVSYRVAFFEKTVDWCVEKNQ